MLCVYRVEFAAIIGAISNVFAGCTLSILAAFGGRFCGACGGVVLRVVGSFVAAMIAGVVAVQGVSRHEKRRGFDAPSFRSRWLCSPPDSVKMRSGVLPILN